MEAAEKRNISSKVTEVEAFNMNNGLISTQIFPNPEEALSKSQGNQEHKLLSQSAQHEEGLSEPVHSFKQKV